MKKRSVVLAVVGSVLMLASGGQAQEKAAHFSGLINDYSPTNVKGGPWEMHGVWSSMCGRNGRLPISPRP